MNLSKFWVNLNFYLVKRDIIFIWLSFERGGGF